jgi:DNA-3-methyladenine glycosylase I
MEPPRRLLRADEHGTKRCWWCGDDPLYVKYHDQEWGFPVADDVRIFEKLCLEGFQAGLSWLTILRKRENFREAFAGFDFQRVARFNKRSVERLLRNTGIVRHRGKIESAINNARCAIDLVESEGSLATFVWQFAPRKRPAAGPCVTTTPESVALSKELKRRGWTFVGPTTMYAFMQAMGMVNDHVSGCRIRRQVESARRKFRRPS